jgi:competence protein ComEA
VSRRDPHPGTERLSGLLGQRPPPPDASDPDAELTELLPAAVEPEQPGRSRLRGALCRLLPEAWRGARLDPGRPGATALALVAIGAALVAAVGVWSQRPRAEPVDTLPVVSADAPAPTPTPTPAATPTPTPAGPLVVSVAGKVRRPGLVEVPAGARVADAVTAAGGPLPGVELSGVNLARKVSDGEQIAVGVPPAPDAGGSAGTEGTPDAGPPGPLDLNLATAEQLDALPGVGPVTAERILEWRSRNGRFTSVEQLREVEGIGERRFGQLRELVRI